MVPFFVVSVGLLQAAGEITVEITPEGLAPPAEPAFLLSPPHPSAATWGRFGATTSKAALLSRLDAATESRARVTITGRDWKPLEPLHPSGRSHGIAFAWQFLPCTCVVSCRPPSACWAHDAQKSTQAPPNTDKSSFSWSENS